MGTGAEVEADFIYWASQRAPDPSEESDLLAGTHPDLQKYTAQVQDLRTISTHFNFSDHGFQVIKHASELLPIAQSNFDFTDTEQVSSKYWPELSRVIEQELGARVCVPFNSAVRESLSSIGSNAHNKEDSLEDRNGEVVQPKKSAKPIPLVHNDIAPLGARNFLHSIGSSFFKDIGCSDNVSPAKQKAFLQLIDEILGDEELARSELSCTDPSKWDGSNYRGPRWGLFSIWRPLDTVRQDPLGLMDSSSIFVVPSTYGEKHTSYVSVPFFAAGKNGAEGYIAPNMMPLMPQQGQTHKWYWMSNQEPDEVYAIKLFDSEAWKTNSRVMPCCPHSAFRLSSADNVPSRRSIETRCLVFW